MILLCTDGLYNFMPEREVTEILELEVSEPWRGNLAEIIVDRVTSKGHPFQDNITVVLLRIKEGR